MQSLKLTNKYSPYSEYKDSGAEWLGDIPRNWEVIRSKRLFKERKTKALPSDEQLTASQEYGVISQKEYMLKKGHSVVQVITGADILKHVEPNDFVISMRSFQGGIEFSKVGGAISSAYVPLIPSEDVYPAYFAYLLKSKSYIQALQLTSNLVRDGQALRFQNFTQVDLPVVPKSEQEKIAKFLDEQTVRIDETIAKKQKLIELLKEKRTATINHAVTKGLDPKAELVDSGIDRLGKIPKAWNLYKFKYIFNIQSGDGFPEKLQGKTSGEFPFLKVSDINGEDLLISISNNYIDHRTVKEHSLHIIKSGSILTAKIGAALGKNHRKINSVDVCIDNNMMAMTPRKPLDQNFAYWLSRTIDMNDFQNISSVPSINMNSLKNSYTTLPPLKVQEQIAEYLNTKIKKCDDVIKMATHSINTLQELKSSLISHAVTGKIKV